MVLSALISDKSRRLGRPALQGYGSERTIPSPVMGWNTRDSRANMKNTYAVRLDNYFPQSGHVSLRRGCRVHSSTFNNAEVQSLFVHQGDSEILLAVAGGKLWNATNGTPTELRGSLENNYWQTANMNGNTIMVNGVDAPIRIQRNGTLASSHGWQKDSGESGTLDISDLSHVLPFKGRLFFIEKNTSNIWYGGVGAIQGDLNRYNTGTFHGAGGNLINMGTLTLDAGSGVDDLLVLFYSNGSALVFQGTNIASASDWSLVGTWNLGRLVGNKPLVKFGGDLIGITTDGYKSMLSLLQSGRISRSTANLSDTIADQVTLNAEIHSEAPNWDCVLFTPASWLIFNLPNGQQHVMNTQTRAWCRFLGWNANCFAVFKEKLYFGSKGEVCQANIGYTDKDDPINGDIETAYNYLGTPLDKNFVMIRPTIRTDGTGRGLLMSVNVDYDRSQEIGLTTEEEEVPVKWNAVKWNTRKWTRSQRYLNEWHGITGTGAAMSFRLISSTENKRISFVAANVLFEIIHRTEGTG